MAWNVSQPSELGHRGEQMSYDYRFRPSTYWSRGDMSAEATIATVFYSFDAVYVTASRRRGRIRYAISDSRGNPGSSVVKTSTRPLTFWRFLRLLNDGDSGVNDEFFGGLILESANYHAAGGGSDRASYAGMASVESDFYPQLSDWTADLWQSWSLGVTDDDEPPGDTCMRRVPVVDGWWIPDFFRRF
ncbi:MAG TPA: hypothetical protein DCE43_01345 [Planctomycetaceae bacterium]|nr:hypothetical protein [Planctomycetaceae bacterium]HCK53483.1 hypothetical protein [Planctomycetaceae bacterium]